MLSKINNITVFFEQGEKLTIPADYIKKFYISNINKNGDEIPYEESGITNKLIANFAIILFSDNTLNQNEFKIFKDNEKLFLETVERYYSMNSNYLPEKNGTREMTLQKL